MKVFKEQFANERGIVLVISLLIIALLLVGGIGAIVSMQTDFKTSGNLKRGTQAFYFADAGINHARQKVQSGSGTSFDCLYNNSCDPQILSSTNFYGGTYTVTRQDSQPTPFPRIKILSEGKAPNNATAKIEAWFKQDGGKPPKAVETNGDLKINGNPKLIGTCGGAHSNDDMQISGNPDIQMATGLTSSNNVSGGGTLPEGMDVSGKPCIGSALCINNPLSLSLDAFKLDTHAQQDAYEAANSSAPVETIPKINPADYAQLVADMGSAGSHYILNDNGSVTTGGTCGTNGLCTGGTTVTTPSGWEYDDGKWKVDGNSAANGVFYAETEVRISGNVGSSSSPWQATIIARDTIKVSGNPDIKPYPSSSAQLQNQLFVTGNDLEISGNMKANYAGGAILVHQQVKISGNPKINGWIIAGDGQATWTGDPFPNASAGVDLNQISGNAEITYSCDTSCTGPSCPPQTVTTVSWAQKF